LDFLEPRLLYPEILQHKPFVSTADIRLIHARVCGAFVANATYQTVESPLELYLRCKLDDDRVLLFEIAIVGEAFEMKD